MAYGRLDGRGLELKMSAFIINTRWLITDSLYRHKGATFQTLALQFFGQVSQIAGLGLSIGYANAVLSGTTLTILDREFVVHGSLNNLLPVVAIASIMLFGSALLAMRGKVCLVRLVRDYEADCTRRALRVFAYSSGFQIPKDPQIDDERTILRLLTKDSRYCGRALNEILLAVIPAVVGLVAFVAIVALDWRPSLIVVFLLALTAPLYLRINRRGAESMELIEQLARTDALIKSDAIRQANNLSIPFHDDDAWIDRILGNETATRYLDAYEYRLRAAHMSIFVGSLLLAGTVSVTLLFAGLQAMQEPAAGATLSMFLLALIYLLASIRSVGKNITNLSIFHLSFGRLIDFLKSAESPSKSPAPENDRDEHELRVKALIHGSLETVTIRRGEPISVIAPDSPMTRLSLQRILDSILAPAESSRYCDHAVIRVRSDSGPLSDDWSRELEDAMAIPHEHTGVSHSRFAVTLRHQLESDRLGATSGQSWRTLPPTSRFLLNWIAALDRQPNWLWLDQKPFRKLTATARDDMIESSRRQFLLLAYTHIPDRMPSCMGDDYILFRDGEPTFIGKQASYDTQRRLLHGNGLNRIRSSESSLPDVDEMNLI